jgi:uncharacterized protein Usg
MDHFNSPSDFRKMLKGYSLTTAQIFYQMPDAKSFLQTFLWQEYDLAPKFPKLTTFCEWWQAILDGKIKAVEVNHSTLIKPAEIKLVGSVFRLH